MIVRSWSARATEDGASSYEAHFRGKVLPELERLEGQRGAMLLRKRDGGEVSLLVLTFWDSLTSIRAFAGDRVDVAVVEDDARAVLSGFDTSVEHYETVVDAR